MIRIILCYLTIINIITFLVYGIDKWKAIKHHWRIPEATLILLAAFGGSLGALAGMLVFRHKIRKIKFVFGVPAILLLQVAVVLFVFMKIR